MEHPPPSHYDELSPPSSVAGQIWDMALTDPDYASHILDSNDTAAPVSARLTRLAHLASHFNPTSKSDSMTLHHCLETLESLLDPRPALTQELARCRPMSHSRQSNSIASISTTDSQDLGNSVASLEEMSHPPLKDILREVTTLREEFDRRRKESSEIYELLTREREILARKIGELDDEIHELNTDILEDTAEREAIQGTIRGLESWVDEWHKQRLLIAAKKQSAASRRNGQRRWTKCKVEEVEGDGEALFEGITAWMRGWKDVEEVFRIREQNRTLRREERQKTRAKYV